MNGNRILAAAALLAGGLVGGFTALRAEEPPVPPGVGDDLRRTAVVRAVESVSPAVVNIATDRYIQREGFASLRDFMMGNPRRWQEKTQSLGTGFVVDPDGWVITNAHVVAQGDTIHVKFGASGGAEEEGDGELVAQVVATDPRSDLALLKIQAEGPFPFVEMGSSHDLLIGEPAIAIGNPFGFSSSVTAGVISAVNRTILLPSGPVDGMIQTDASIDPGNSGGPLLNIHGQLVGVNTAVFREGRNIAFAIPVDRVKTVLGGLIDPIRSSQVWSGFEVKNRGRTLVVDTVAKGGPAAGAGLRPGDVIARCESGEPCSVYAFKAALLRKGRGEKVALHLTRGKGTLDVEVPLVEHPGLALLRGRLGIEVEPQMMPQRDGTSVVRFLVTEVREGSAADRVEIRPKDVVGMLAGMPLESADEVAALLRQIPRKEVVPIRVFRAVQGGWRWADTELSLD